jgi:uncharacterized protein YcnI
MTKRLALGALIATATALVLTATAWAHAEISPPIVKAKASQVFTLAVPTEKDGIFTTKIEMTPPTGFAIDSFVPAPGWTRAVIRASGENAVIQKVAWTGGSVPTGEDAAFAFLGSSDASKTYTFGVEQTYSDGSVVDWSGPESSDTPAVTVEAKASLGGGGSSTLALVALVVGAVGILLGGFALVARSGRQLA